MPEKKGLRQVQPIITNLIQSLGLNSKRLSWVYVVEKYLSGFSQDAKVVGFKNNKIYIEVESSVLLQELSLRKREISKLIQGSFPAEAKQEQPEIKIFIKGLARPSRKEILE